MAANYKSNYKLLGLSHTARWPDAKSRYRKLVQTWHPDKFDHSSAEYAQVQHKFLEITKAYDQLKSYYKKHQLLPFEKIKSEETTEILDLSRRNMTGQRRTTYSRNRSNHSKLPLVIGLLLLFYLVYNSINEESASNHKTNILDPDFLGSSDPTEFDVPAQSSSRRTVTTVGDYFGKPHTSVGNVLTRQLFK